MSRQSIVKVRDLDPGLILAPERYDSLRQRSGSIKNSLDNFVVFISDLVTPAKIGNNQRFIVINTSNALAGKISTDMLSIPGSELGSTKKLLKSGDIIISRLRSYLRQVAFIDQELLDSIERNTLFVCSTEFYVLRCISKQSIAFLVPFLLSEPAQSILQASQEGGHHPRFNQKTLERLQIPRSILEIRDDLSTAVEAHIKAFRHSDLALKALIQQCSVPNTQK